MRKRIAHVACGLFALFLATLGQSFQRSLDPCASGEYCYSPARLPQCPRVRFAAGECPGSGQPCDFCYGPNGAFAYWPSIGAGDSDCTRFPANTTWIARNPAIAQMMSKAGGRCLSDSQGVSQCASVNVAQFKRAASCISEAEGREEAHPETQPRTDRAAAFTYFYINGVNTPRTNADWRGSCQSEHDTTALNLIDDLRFSNPRLPRAEAPLANIKVASESDRMYGLTCNPPTPDPNMAGWVQHNCPAGVTGIIGLGCEIMKQVNSTRARAGSGLTAGDLWECARQSINLPSWIPHPKGVDIQATANEPIVLEIVRAILASYQRERNSYFIVIGYSQGNFFAEGVAYNLLHYSGAEGQEIFTKHLGIISLASPTSFETLRSNEFASTKIVHHTRADDAINIVTTVNSLLHGYSVSGKRPWAPNDPPLWPWPTSQPVSSLFAPDQITFPCDVRRGYIPAQNCDMFNATFWRRIEYNPGRGVSNPELYAPLLNSHLFDNYIEQPAATRPGLRLATDPLVPFTISPRTTSVLNCIRHDLWQLKSNLLNGTSAPVTTTCAGK